MSDDTAAAPAALACDVIGEGDAGVILLHGFLGSGRNLRTLAQRWQQRQPEHRFLLPDLRGHGVSPPLPAGDAPVTLADLAADVLATAQHYDLRAPFHLVGHSLGGRVALAAARLAPDSIAEITLLDIGPGPIDQAFSESRRVLDMLIAAPAEAADRRELRAFFVGRGLSVPLADWLLMNLDNAGGRVHWRIDRAALDRLHGKSMNEDLWDVVQGHEIPISCIRGGRSRYVSDAEAVRLRAAGCPTTTLPDAGHFVHVDALPALLDLLTGEKEVTE
jgi:pimeloyl-ACP methyl ester carboxylesterase